MECHKIVGWDEDGNPITKPKRRYVTIESAINASKLMNVKQDRLMKLNAYHCTECGGFHCGRNGDLMSPEEKKKLSIKNTGVFNLKVVGKIDLSLIKDNKKKKGS